MRRLFLMMLLCCAPTLAAAADATAEQVVDAHFKAILAADYDGAAQYFSTAFNAAFKVEDPQLRDYYVTRKVQLEPGYRFGKTEALNDPGKQTAVVVVDFGDPRETAPVQISERMHYYLIREKVKGKAFGAGPDGTAWRIDIFDALRYGSLAEARRRPYLYTAQAWPENTGRELKSRQGLFRLQWALSSYRQDKGGYPLTLSGGEDREDVLIAGSYLAGRYPVNGFTEAPMRAVGLEAQGAGDFTYIAVDAQGDGTNEAYWLLLHGAEPDNFYFSGTDIVYVLGSTLLKDQTEMAAAFAGYWQAGSSEPLEVTAAPTRMVRLTGDRPAPASPVRPTAVATASAVNTDDAPRRAADAPAVGVMSIWAAARGELATQWVLAGLPRAVPQHSPAPAALLPAGTYPPLRIYSYGF
jgi:hypothetical protein